MRVRWVIIVIMLCFLKGFIFGATTGKIKGIIVDSETGAPLPGANVVVSGTKLGAAAGMDGDYFIINVPPGVYDIQATYMGYTNQMIQNVMVYIDRTTTINIELNPSVIESDEAVTVYAKREKIRKDVSFSQSAMVEEDIKAAPTSTDVRSTVAMNVSLDRDAGTGELQVRGSMIDEVGLIVDDFASQDKRFGTPVFRMSKESIQEIQLLTGGFSAEYGQARSGIINVVTKEGGTEYHGSLKYQRSQPAYKHFGPDAYSGGNWWEIGRYQFIEANAVAGGESIPYAQLLEDENLMTDWMGREGATYVSWRGDTLLHLYNERGQNIDRDLNGEPDWEGWQAWYDRLGVGRTSPYIMNDQHKDDSSPEELLEMFNWFFRPFSYADYSDHNVEFTLHGPVPFSNKKMTFFLDGYVDQQAYPTKTNKKYMADYSLNAKIKYTISPDMILRYRGSYGEIQTVSFGQSYQSTPDPRNFLQVRASYMTLARGKNMFNFGSRATSYYKFFQNHGLKFTHVLSPSTFYELNFQMTDNKYDMRYDAPWRDNNTPAYITKTDDTPFYLSEAPLGKYETWSGAATGAWYDDEGIEHIVHGGPPVLPEGVVFGYFNETQDNSRVKTYNLKGDITSQINSQHQLKAGFGLNYSDMALRYGYSEEMMAISSQSYLQSSIGDFSILEGWAYIKDKIEYEGLVLDMGLRADFYKPKGNFYTELWNEYYDAGLNYDSLSYATHEDAPFKLAVGPRIGISHPITDNAKLYFNYGYFYQKASISDLLVPSVRRLYTLMHLPNADLEFRKTINYEFGVEHNVADIFTYKLTGYYKDVYNEIGGGSQQRRYISITYPDLSYSRPENNMYRDIRGVEAEVQFPFLRYFRATANYNYMIENRGWYGYINVYEDPFEFNELVNADQQQPKPRPIFRSWLTFSTPTAPNAKTFWERLKSDWLVSGYWYWKAGQWFTYQEGKWAQEWPGAVNNVQWIPFHNGIDLNIRKGFKWNGYKITAFCEVFNLLNSKFLVYEGMRSDSYHSGLTFGEYMEALEDKGIYKAGSHSDKDIEALIMNTDAYYAVFSAPRDIWFGLMLEF